MICKTAMITIAGRPNVGKSTLTNALVGEKISIVSNKPQTTRNRICGIVNQGDYQLIFADTPGFHKSRNRLDSYMSKTILESVSDVDAVFLMVEPIPNIGPQEEGLIASLRENNMPAVLLINKIDSVEPDALLPVIDVYRNAYEFDDVIPISAKKSDGIDLVIEAAKRYASDGPQLFPDDLTSDQPEKQIAAELIREKLLWCLDKEVPHGTAVEITRFTERDNGIVDVDAVIYCEKPSHKGIIIGKQGAMLKKISTMARQDFEKYMGTQVYMTTWVKVKENWRESSGLLRSFGYTNE